MLKDILRKLQLLGVSRAPIDPVQFEDPLALKIEWTPASRGGANFRTHKLVEAEFSRVEFRAAMGARVFYSIFFFAGLLIGTGFLLEDNIFENLSFEAIAPACSVFSSL